MIIKSYVGETIVPEIHDGKVVYTTTLIIPRITKKELNTLLNSINDIGEITITINDQN